MKRLLFFSFFCFWMFFLSPLAQGQELPPPVEKPREDSAIEESRLEGSDAEKELREQLKGKEPLSDEDLAKKKEEGYFTGLPLVNSDPDTGIGYGVRGYYYYNGDRDDFLFKYTPYFYRTFFQYFATTNGLQSHGVEFDAPYLFDTLYRLNVSLFYEKNISANYFGDDSKTLSPLRLPSELNQEKTYTSLQDYNNELRKIQDNGLTYSRYNHYTFEEPYLEMIVNRDFWGGSFKIRGGVRLANTKIEDYTGKTVKANDDKSAIMGKTKLQEDQDAGLIKGYSGGVNSTLQVGLVYDTRDFEPNPKKGTFTDFLIESSGKSLGSDFNYSRYTLTSRIYYSPAPEDVKLVLAARGLLGSETGEVPFFARQTQGGIKTLRGYRKRRFAGKIQALTNFEARWTFSTGESFDYMLAAFIDRGRVFDQWQEVRFNDWKQGQGLALRIAWNLSTIIVVEYGVSSEDSGLYINFNHIF